MLNVSSIISTAKQTVLAALPSDFSSDEAIVPLINLGLVELHSKFPIRTKESLIVCKNGINRYSIADDFMFFIAAYGEGRGFPYDDEPIRLPVNEEGEKTTVYLPEFNTIEIPYSEDETYVSIVYAPNPRFAVFTEEGLKENVDIPIILINSLIDFIGYRARMVLSNDQLEFATIDSYRKRFEQGCDRIKMLGLFPATESIQNKSRIYSKTYV